MSYTEITGHFNKNYKVVTSTGLFHLKIFKDGTHVIKPWIDGNTITTWDEDAIKKVCTELQALHSSVQEWQPMDFFKIAIDDQSYNVLVRKYQNTLVSPCHNDLNKDNVVIDNTHAHLIDFEFKRLNNLHWDIANIVNEDKLNKKQIALFLKYYVDLDQEVLDDFIYINKVFTDAWKQKHMHKDL